MTTPNAAADPALVARACGVLATALTDSLHSARDLVRAEAAHLPPGSADTLESLLAEFSRRRIRIALFGEVKAGKSTLINAIAGRALSPVAFDPLTSVPVHVTYGPQTSWLVNEHRLESIQELEQFMRVHPFDAAEVLVTTPLDLLALGGQVDLLDTPGMGSLDHHFDRITGDTLELLDAVVLVVRYPGLFTRFTQELVQNLTGKISKLFVVWNLDRACADVPMHERTRYAEQLSAHIGMPHELYLVDARQALEQGQDPQARATSGLDAFVTALRNYVASSARDVAALREVAKAAVQWLEQILPHLRSRFEEVDRHVREARAAIAAVQQTGEQELAEARQRQSNYEASIAQLAEHSRRRAALRRQKLVEDIHAARRRWMRTGHLFRLERAVATAVAAYATDIAALAKDTRDQLVTAAAAFGADLSLTPRGKRQPEVGRLAPEDRNVRANSGRLRILRRALWKQWYLPGLERFERETLVADARDYDHWLQGGAHAAVQVGRSTTAERLRRIAERTAARVEEVRAATLLAAYEAEHERLHRGLPDLEAEMQKIRHLAEQARLLLSQGSER